MPTPTWRRVFRLDVGRHVERDVNQEIAFHLDMRTQKLIAAGMDPASAATKALEQFGDLPAVRDECLTIGYGRERRMKWSDHLSAVAQDARYAVRSLGNQLGFTIAVVLILAIGIGANTSIFSVVDALLLRNLEVPHPEQLVTIGDPSMISDSWTGSPKTEYVSYPVYADLRDQNTVLSGLYATGASSSIDVVATGAWSFFDQPRGRLVSGNFFAVLGVPAHVGRTFTAAEDKQPLGDPVAMISYGYWQRRFGGDRSAIGSRITVNATPLEIIGVTPPAFVGDIVGQSIDVWLPMMMQPAIRSGRSLLSDRSASWLLMMGRLAPGVTIAQARTALTVLETRSIRDRLTGLELSRFDEDLAAAPVRVEAGGRGFSRYRAAYAQALTILMSAVALVILIVCANVANLMLARANARGREMTVRMALGAGRRRLIQQLLTECALLAGAAGVLGLVGAYWGSRLLLVLASTGPVPIPINVAPDARVLAFTAGVTLVSTLLFGLLPALRATRVDVATALRAHGRSLTGAGGRLGRFAVGKSLVVGQIALSMLLLIGTGLLARSMQRILSADLGFDRARLLTVEVEAARSGYQGARGSALIRDMTERIQRVPGVTAVSFAGNGVFSGGESSDHVTVPGFVAQADSELSVFDDAVGPRYFQTVGANLVRGREFDAHDAERAARVVVINETMAKRYFGNGDPIGRTVIRDSVAFTIVGVVRDLQSDNVRGKPARMMYVSMLQEARFPRGFIIVVRVAASPSAFVRQLRGAILELDGKLVHEINPVDDLIRTSVAEDILVTQVTTFFGILALALAALGLYGVTAYATSQRTGELGLRAALGAEPASVMRLILGEAVALAMIGVCIGLPVGLAATRAIRGRLFGVGPIDVPTLGVAVIVLLVTAIVASYLPARRAARVGPLEALRAE
jgi:predicted permease